MASLLIARAYPAFSFYLAGNEWVADSGVPASEQMAKPEFIADEQIVDDLGRGLC